MPARPTPTTEPATRATDPARTAPAARDARTATVAALALTVAVALAACGSGSAAEPSDAVASIAPSPAGVSPSPVASASPSPVAPASPAPSPTAGVLDSNLYPYSWTLPPEALELRPTLATIPWDGSAVMGSTSEYTDRFYLPGSKLTFTFSAPTDDALEPYAAYIHARAVQDHACPADLEADLTLELDGSPATLAAFACQDLYVLELSTVRDGVGLVIKQLAPRPYDLGAHIDAFETLLAGFAWDD
jgi:hypothetical protein